MSVSRRSQGQRLLCFRDLRDVAIAIAAIHIVLSVAAAVAAALTLLGVAPLGQLLVDFLQRAGVQWQWDAAVWCGAGVLVAALAVALPSSLLLLHGARRGRRRLLVPWLVGVGLLQLVASLAAAALLVAAVVGQLWPEAVVTALLLVVLAMMWTWYATVFAHHYTMC